MVRFWSSVATVVAVCLAAYGPVSVAWGAPTPSASADAQRYFQTTVRPVLETFCFGCHGPTKQKAKLRLDTLGIDLVRGPEAETWHDVLNNLNVGDMPPEDAAAPSAAQRAIIVDWLTKEFEKAAKIKRSTGGRVVLRRLTRYEYNNTMRDLLGIDMDYARDLPPEPTSPDGFKNNGSSLGMSPIQIEYYLAAARLALQRAIVTGPEPKVHRHLITDSREVTRSRNRGVKPYASKRLQGGGEFVAKLREFPRTGRFVVRVKAAAAIPVGSGYPLLSLSLGVRSDTQTPEEQSGVIEVPGRPQPLPQLGAAPAKQTPPNADPRLEQLADLDSRIESLQKKLADKSLPKTEQKKLSDERRRLTRERQKLDRAQRAEQQKRADAANERRLVQPIDEPRVFEFTGQIDQFPLPGHNPKFPGLLVILRNVYDGKHDTVELPGVKQEEGNRSTKTPKFKVDPRLPAIHVESVEFIGPVFDTWPPAHHKRILFDSALRDDESAYARVVLERFISRAFRRPATTADVDSKLAFFRKVRPKVASFEAAIRETLAMVLISPQFLYLVEPSDPSKPAKRLSEYELVSRLSYFLWSTTPDDTLTQLAANGKLRQRQVLEQTIRKMIADDRSNAFAKHFTDQWLGLAGVDRVAVNPEYYPDFDDRLKPQMRQETHVFFKEILRNDLSALNLIDSDFVMVNRALAQHYGLAKPLGHGFQRVAVKPQDRRGGLLTQGSILLSNSTGEDAHAIRRGVWLLDRLLGDPPAPPPPDVPELNPQEPDLAGLPTRKQLELHRRKEACNSCHRGIDPWGVAFEHYDAVGLWRDEVVRVVRKGQTRRSPVEARSVLPGGHEVSGIDDLKTYLLRNETDRFSRALVERLLAYSLGRSLEWSDEATVKSLVTQFQKSDYRISDLIVAIVASEPFQHK